MLEPTNYETDYRQHCLMLQFNAFIADVRSIPVLT